MMATSDTTANIARLLDKRQVVGECWEWQGGRDRKGYGRVRVNPARTTWVHRYSYELHTGPIPTGLQIDHLCRNPPCFNPEHLEAVTPRENFLRGEAPTAKTARTNICLHGHDLSDAYVRSDGTGRQCRTCVLDRSRRRDRKATRDAETTPDGPWTPGRIRESLHEAKGAGDDGE